MKAICFCFQVHQPLRFKRYRFFDIGSEHYYYDDFANEDFIRGVAERTYFPANNLLLDMIEKYNGRFKVTFSISGTVLEQLEIYVPEVLEQFRELAKTGCVEFLSETYGHSLASLTNPKEFVKQVKAHSEKIQLLFGQIPKIFRNSELIYSDDIALQVANMDFKAILVEGAKHVLGWKSPNYLYSSASVPTLKLLTRNMKFSDDISFRFSDHNWSEYPLIGDKFVKWIADTPNSDQLVNIFTTYDILGGLQAVSTGIFDFFKSIPRFALMQDIGFLTPLEVIDMLDPVGELIVPYPCSWAGEEKDTSDWMGNLLQKEAISKLYSLAEKVHLISDRRILQDWNYLQATDHFHYMSTRYFAERSVFSPYENAYDAFNNYMNILSDFTDRVNGQFPEGVEDEELNALQKTILNQDEEIKRLEQELKKVKSRLL
ncbi:glycoside hydrolase family 57 protein [Candidatus Azobacteroides pseudotrichonymphae]|jgi:alpha-amylase|uniref:Alpha-amylase n=1 Tax=Azobacteroides pseudotrichonymphae genomovar. CFP2 TaxID=511995 RepID=B6YRE8_AZOPC|nr:glycoside hydrolase family 57 protein [Candidatus Azobacteroides pseudotrichonymphae]MDR0530227.1 glycoside hydrolase family 57 protein [Bacteroidales bacterium OttesenSCG-928-I14]BAG83770.1 alpha-amylase [Candidatus Azobacteroides pseudotrichonymphae genomovar. CFP2]